MNHGRHIKVMGKGLPDSLGEVSRVENFLTDLVADLGMRPLGAPVMHDVAIDLKKKGVEPFEDEGGVTGIVVLSTSHASIHTWPARHKDSGFFILDVFSCRDFSPATVLNGLQKTFSAFDLKVQNLDVTYDGE